MKRFSVIRKQIDEQIEDEYSKRIDILRVPQVSLFEKMEQEERHKQIIIETRRKTNMLRKPLQKVIKQMMQTKKEQEQEKARQLEIERDQNIQREQQLLQEQAEQAAKIEKEIKKKLQKRISNILVYRQMEQLANQTPHHQRHSSISQQ